MFKDIVGTLWKSDAKKDEPAKAPVATPVVSPMVGGSASVSAPVTPVLDVEHITQAIDTLIKENPAYSALASFLTTVGRIPAQITDEPLRYTTAQATSGVPVPELVAAASSFRDVIGREVDKFNQQYVATTENEIANVSAQIPVLEQQMADLTAKLGELSQKKSELAASIIAKTADLEKAKADFKSIVATLDARYSETEKKVSQYLGAVNG